MLLNLYSQNMHFQCGHFYLLFYGRDFKKLRRTVAKAFESEPDYGKTTFSEIRKGRKSGNENNFLLRSETAMYIPQKLPSTTIISNCYFFYCLLMEK